MNGGGDDLVDEEVARLRADEGRIAWEPRRVELLQDRGDVEGLVRGAVAVPPRVERGEDDEDARARDVEERSHRSGPRGYIASSALGP